MSYQCREKNNVVICDDGAREFMCVRGLDGKLECSSAFELSMSVIAERQLEEQGASHSNMVGVTVTLAVCLLAFSVKKLLASR